MERTKAAKQQRIKRARGSILVASSAIMAWLIMLEILFCVLRFKKAPAVLDKQRLQRESGSSRISVVKHRRGRS